ncbi:MAG: fibronectin type III domain-containing protein [Clostridia bacterium]|nr:fibronectin type III domain-containing protein [Clostridia bacterium]
MKRMTGLFLAIVMLLGMTTMFSYAADAHATAAGTVYYELGFVEDNLESLARYIDTYGERTSTGMMISDVDISQNFTYSTIITSESDGVHFYFFAYHNKNKEDHSGMEMVYSDDIGYTLVHIEDELMGCEYICEGIIDILNYIPDENEISFSVIKNTTPLGIDEMNESMNIFFDLGIAAFQYLLNRAADMDICELGFSYFCDDHRKTIPWYTEEPTCSENGEVEYICKWCGRIMSTRTVPPTGKHNYVAKTTPATTTSNGSVTTVCADCGAVGKTKKIYRIDTVTLNTTSFTYDGSVKTPTVTVKDIKGNVINSKYYTVKYSSGRTEIGAYKVKVVFKGLYSGTASCAFKIVPGRVTDLKAASKKVGIAKVAWSPVDGAQKYVIYCAASKKGDYQKVAVTSKTAFNVKGLDSGATYYFIVKALTQTGGKNYYSAASNIAKAKVK